MSGSASVGGNWGSVRAINESGANSPKMSNWRSALTRYLLRSKMQFESWKSAGAGLPCVAGRKTADACHSQTQLPYKPRRTPGLSLWGANQDRRNVHNISVRVELSRCRMVPCSCLHAKKNGE